MVPPDWNLRLKSAPLSRWCSRVTPLRWGEGWFDGVVGRDGWSYRAKVGSTGSTASIVHNDHVFTCDDALQGLVTPQALDRLG